MIPVAAPTGGGVAPSRLGSSFAKFLPGLTEGQVSYVEYTPDPRIAQYISSSRKRRSEAAPE